MPRIAIVEPATYHEETLFALASAIPPGVELHVFAEDHRGSRTCFSTTLGLVAIWRAAAAFGGDEQFDLVILNTFPTIERDVTERALRAGRVVLAVVHHPRIWADSATIVRELQDNQHLSLAYVTPGPPGIEWVPKPLRSRIHAFFPVMSGPICGTSGPEVALPGTIEFSRRDYAAAFRLAHAVGRPLHVFGRTGHNFKSDRVREDLERDRKRYFSLVAAYPDVDVTTTPDPLCHDYFNAVARAACVALMPVDPAYLGRKLSGAVTAAISCGVPVLATRAARETYVGGRPDLGDSMVEFNSSWDGPLHEIEGGARHAAVVAREVIIKENTATIGRLVGA